MKISLKPDNFLSRNPKIWQPWSYPAPFSYRLLQHGCCSAITTTRVALEGRPAYGINGSPGSGATNNGPVRFAVVRRASNALIAYCLFFGGKNPTPYIQRSTPKARNRVKIWILAERGGPRNRLNPDDNCNPQSISVFRKFRRQRRFTHDVPSGARLYSITTDFLFCRVHGHY